MADTSQSRTARDRAFAELARARGWVDDAALDRVIAESSAPGAVDVAVLLRKAGLLSAEQVNSLWSAVDGVDRSASAGSVGTWARGGSAATIRPAEGRTTGSSASGETLRAPSSASGETLRAPSSSADRGGTAFPSGDGGATLTPSQARSPSASAGSFLAKSTSGEKSGDRIGPYKLMRELGRGGMGVVYRAVHLDLRREVALKVMLAGIPVDDPDTERFRREAGLVARLGRHPNLVSVHEIGREEDRLYFTMDYIDGRSARQRVEDEGAFPPREAAAVCADIAAALEFVHKAGVLHRDVKPHNVLIDTAGKAYLSDFGLAKGSEEKQGLTLSGAALGTPSYMAPEIAARGAKNAAPSSDIYSLGATLFEMLTGHPPFTGLSGIDLIRAVAERDAPSPRALRPDLHPDLDVICERAMEKDPARRFASAAEFEADLRRYVNGEPILARPIGRWEKLARKAKRNAGVLSAAVLAVAVLATAGTWSGVKWWRKDQAQKALAAERADRERRAEPLLSSGRAMLKACDDAEAAGRDAERAAGATKAAETLSEAVHLLPDDAEARFLLGRALRRAGQPIEALAELERAVELNPKHSLAWFEHGLIAQEAYLKVRGVFNRRIAVAHPNEFGYRVTSEPSFQSWITAGKGAVDRPWRDIAAKDFERVVATGAAGELAAYGRAMIKDLDGKYDEALREMDAAVEMNPYFAPALSAEAEIREYATQDATQGLPWRKRLHDVQPQNPEVSLGYAVSLVAVGRRDEARELLLAATKDRDGYDLLSRAAWTLVTAAVFTDGEALARRSLAAAKTDPDRIQAISILREALTFQRRFDDARKVLDENAKLYDPDYIDALKGSDFAEEGKFPEAVASFRAIPKKSAYRRWVTQTEAWSEWTCGNVFRAKALAEQDAKPGTPPPINLPIIRLDLGELDEAIAEIQSQLAQNPDNPGSWSNLAGARFLKNDYTGAMDALEQAFIRSPVPAAMKEQAKNLFVDFRKRAVTAKTAAEGGKIVESIGGMVTLAVAQGGANAEGAGAGRDALRSIWWGLQEFYWRNNLPKESHAAGSQYLTIRRHGNVLFKQSRASAARGKTDSALKELREAMEQGFDEAMRLDKEPAFDALRQLPGYVELRGKCR